MFLEALLILLGWHIIGVIACVAVDNKENTLLKWAKTGPYGFGPEICMMLWPFIVYMRIKNGPLKPEET